MAPRAAAGAELEAALGEMVEHRDALGDLRGVVHLGEWVEDARADVDALGGLGEITGHHVVGRQVRVLVEEVVLGEPHVLEPGSVGRLHRRDLVHEGAMLGLDRIVAPAGMPGCTPE